MKRSKKNKIHVISLVNIFLLIILITCSCVYHQNNTGLVDEEQLNENQTEDINFSDDINNSLKEWDSLQNEEKSKEKLAQISPTPTISSREENDGKSEKQDGKTQSEKIVSNIETNNTKELSFYSNLPYYNNENTERYIDYKRKNPDYSHEKIISYVNIGLDNGFYENVKTVDNGHDITVLVNKYNKLQDDYEPELVELDSSMCVSDRGAQYLHKQALDAFTTMRDDAKQLGLNITAYGTYRSIELQHLIWNNAVNSGRTIEDVDSLNSRGGHSEHHTGLAIDVIRNNNSIEETEEYKWYSKNAHKYGFIIRYPKGKEHITGYKYEPWHLRYVGPEIASDIYQRGITYEEYYVTILQPKEKIYASDG